MTARTVEAAPSLWARIAGVFYLLNILTGAFAVVFVGRRLVVYGDAANLIPGTRMKAAVCTRYGPRTASFRTTT